MSFWVDSVRRTRRASTGRFGTAPHALLLADFNDGFRCFVAEHELVHTTVAADMAESCTQATFWALCIALRTTLVVI